MSDLSYKRVVPSLRVIVCALAVRELHVGNIPGLWRKQRWLATKFRSLMRSSKYRDRRTTVAPLSVSRVSSAEL